MTSKLFRIAIYILRNFITRVLYIKLELYEVALHDYRMEMIM